MVYFFWEWFVVQQPSVRGIVTLRKNWVRSNAVVGCSRSAILIAFRRQTIELTNYRAENAESEMW
jgi:hypothetical protein